MWFGDFVVVLVFVWVVDIGEVEEGWGDVYYCGEGMVDCILLV